MREELRKLQEEEQRLAKNGELKSREGASEANIQATMEEPLNAVMMNCEEAETKRHALNKALTESQTKRECVGQKTQEIEQSEAEAAKATRAGAKELSLRQLEE